MLQFYNTLSRKKEAFIPIDDGAVRMYTCGPTIYNFAHIGNFRAYIFEDLLRRYLQYKEYAVTQVMNITDVDDKIIRDSNAGGVSISAFTQKYREAFFEDMDTLRIQRAEHYPNATGHIDAMVTMVEQLLENGYAYRADDGSIYYSVDKFEEYGQLANLNPDEMQHAERVESDEYEKEGIRDFALWKAWKPEDGDAFWETSLGKGRPGWHIECSAMSTAYLGNHFDIHTGGVDNIFPHHENEIAQTRGATGEPFVNYWLHCEHLIVEGQKMSKSLGNFYNLRDVLERGYAPEVVRYALLSTHYRQKLNFTWEKLDEAASAIGRLRTFRDRLERVSTEYNDSIQEKLDEYSVQFEEALDDDLNIAGALGAVFSMVKDLNQLMDQQNLGQNDARLAVLLLDRFDSILDVLELSEAEEEIPEEVRSLVNQRSDARAQRDYARADELRDEISKRGYTVEDTPEGPVIHRK